MRSNWRILTTLACLVLLASCTVNPPPVEEQQGPVQAPPQPVQLSSDDASAAFELQNVSDRTLDWQIEVDHDADNPQSGDWFRIEPEEGTMEPRERQLVTLTQRSGIEPGDYTSTLRVEYDGGPTLFEVIGRIDPNGDGQPGDSTIRGRLETPNSQIPIRPPDISFARTSSLGTAAGLAADDDVSESGTDQENAQYLPDQLVLSLEPTLATLSASQRTNRLDEIAAELGATVLESSSGHALLSLPEGIDPTEAAALLGGEPGVRFAEPNYLFRLHAATDDPYIEDAWQLPVVGAPVAWEALGGVGTPPVVAVIDSGFDLDHEDLRGVFVNDGYDFCGSTDCPVDDRDGDARPDDSFFNTHGTHVAGLVAAIGDNGRGSAGVLPERARLVPIKTFTNGSTTEIAVADAIRWAAGGNVDNAPRNPDPANIITVSLGSTGDSRLVREAIQYAQSQGALVIASAGNDGHGTVDYPARYPEVLGVGAVNSEFRRSCFSDYGEGLDIVAPGGDGYLCDAPRDEALLSTFPDDDYGLDAGTSMAAPLVAGAAALVWASMDLPDAQRVADRLVDTAWFDSDYMDDRQYGAGVLRLDRALGFPGPGDEATIQAVGQSNRLDTVTLDARGGSSEFVLDDLAAGSYGLEAEAAGRSRALTGSENVSLSQDEQVTTNISLAP